MEKETPSLDGPRRVVAKNELYHEDEWLVQCQRIRTTNKNGGKVLVKRSCERIRDFLSKRSQCSEKDKKSVTLIKQTHEVMRATHSKQNVYSPDADSVIRDFRLLEDGEEFVIEGGDRKNYKLVTYSAIVRKGENGGIDRPVVPLEDYPMLLVSFSKAFPGLPFDPLVQEARKHYFTINKYLRLCSYTNRAKAARLFATAHPASVLPSAVSTSTLDSRTSPSASISPSRTTNNNSPTAANNASTATNSDSPSTANNADIGKSGQSYIGKGPATNGGDRSSTVTANGTSTSTMNFTETGALNEQHSLTSTNNSAPTESAARKEVSGSETLPSDDDDDDDVEVVEDPNESDNLQNVWDLTNDDTDDDDEIETTPRLDQQDKQQGVNNDHHNNNTNDNDNNRGNSNPGAKALFKEWSSILTELVAAEGDIKRLVDSSVTPSIIDANDGRTVSGANNNPSKLAPYLAIAERLRGGLIRLDEMISSGTNDNPIKLEHAVCNRNGMIENEHIIAAAAAAAAVANPIVETESSDDEDTSGARNEESVSTANFKIEPGTSIVARPDGTTVEAEPVAAAAATAGNLSPAVKNEPASSILADPDPTAVKTEPVAAAAATAGNLSRAAVKIEPANSIVAEPTTVKAEPAAATCGNVGNLAVKTEPANTVFAEPTTIDTTATNLKHEPVDAAEGAAATPDRVVSEPVQAAPSGTIKDEPVAGAGATGSSASSGMVLKLEPTATGLSRVASGAPTADAIVSEPSVTGIATERKMERETSNAKLQATTTEVKVEPETSHNGSRKVKAETSYGGEAPLRKRAKKNRAD